MTKLNHQYFNKKTPTDVISFSYEDIPGAVPGAGEEVSGEVIVNAQRARETGPRHTGINHELALYVAHGCNHLSGADDRTDAERHAMRNRELAWLSDPACAIHLEALLDAPGERTD